MKLCSVVLVVVSLAFVCVNGREGGQGEGPFEKLLKKCREESNMDTDAMKKSLASSNADGKLNCPIECICKGIGIMNDDGGLDEAKAEKIVAKISAPAKEILKSCMYYMKANLPNCQSGGELIKCILPKWVQMTRKQ